MGDEIEQVLDDCVRGGAFFVPPPGKLRIERAARARHVFLDRPDLPNDRPLIEIAVEHGRIHVRRHVAMRGGEWIGEHLGSAPSSPRRELVERCIEMALVGTSRLPITSIETPLPAYTLGMIAYVPGGGGAEAIRDTLMLAPRVADESISVERRARTLENLLRSASSEQMVAIARALAPIDLAPILRAMFNLLVLSPYTCLVDNLVALLLHIDRPAAIGAIGYMLRHLARHLNAFDLVRFHNRGANFPDALMLDALLRAFVPMLDDRPTTRRALLHGWLARKRCEHLLVPAAPTSPGEAARLMPSQPLAADPEHRTRRLFHDTPAEAMLTPAAWHALRRAAAEADPTELGTATFLDRPLGSSKRSGQPDRTPLLSYEAFSRRLAQRRARELVDLGLLPAAPSPRDVPGYPVAKMPGHARDGVVSLEDAKKVALDFVFTRTTRSSLDGFLRQYDWTALAAATPELHRWFREDRIVLLIRTARAMMTAFDALQRPMLTLNYADARYEEWAGEELLDGIDVVVEGKSPVPVARTSGSVNCAAT